MLLTKSTDVGCPYANGFLFNPATKKEEEVMIRLTLPPASSTIMSRGRFVGFGHGAKSKAYKAGRGFLEHLHPGPAILTLKYCFKIHAT